MSDKGLVLITGAGGQLGKELIWAIELESSLACVPLDRQTLDIVSPEQVLDACLEYRPGFIVNCAAYTKVDQAESEPDAAYGVNSKGAANLARAANRLGVCLVHISTDFVFDGKKTGMYHEDDPPHPQSIYGQSKLEGEKQVIQLHDQTIVLRTGWVYSSFGKNFVQTILRAARERDCLRVVADQVGTPTYARELAQAILRILPKADKGFGQIFHYANEGVASWYDLAWSIVRFAGLTCSVEPIESNEYPTAAKRPMYSVLSKKKIKQTFGLDMPHWMDSLHYCLQEFDSE